MARNLKLQISVVEAKVGSKNALLPSLGVKVKSRVKGAKKEYLSLQLVMLLKEKLQQKLVRTPSAILYDTYNIVGNFSFTFSKNILNG